MLDMKEYPYWAYNLAVSGNTRINKDRYYKLMELADHCGRCPKTTPFETFQTLTFNFRYVLKDMLQVFGMHARQIGDDTLDFHKFYHDHIYNHDTPKEEQEYCDEVLLIGDLTFEMTRILNLLLERIREYEPGFMAAYGIMTIIDATDATGKSDTPIEFKAAEKSERPYPGLSRFLDERGSRTHHLSQGRNLEDTLRRELVI